MESLDTIDALRLGLQIALRPENLGFAGIGVTVGTLVGVLPGIGPLVAIALLLPMTFRLEPTGGLIMLAGIYYGAQYGGSTTAILLSVPGEVSSVMTAVDGYQMRLKGRAGPALGIAAMSSFVAGLVGVAGLFFVSVPLARLALAFGPPEYVALTLMAMTSVVVLSSGVLIRGFMSALAGLLLATVGPDIVSGVPRFTFGRLELLGGIELAVLAIGLFALGEVVHSYPSSAVTRVPSFSIRQLLPSIEEIRLCALPVLRSSILGFLVGVLPGAGAGIASFIAYGMEKRLAKRPDRFGRGAVEGVAAPEAANNAASEGAFVPTLSLGIPGSGTMAVLLGLFIIYGLQPGPQLFREHPDLVWGLITSMLIGNLMLIVLNLPLVGLFVQILRFPYPVLAVATVILSLLGSYAVNNSLWDIGVAIAFGLMGLGMRRFGYPLAPLVLGFVLGRLGELSFRQSLLLTDAGVGIFFFRPIAAGLLAFSLAIVLVPIVLRVLRSRSHQLARPISMPVEKK